MEEGIFTGTFYKIHRWLSLICALFFLLLTLTGLPLLFRSEIEAWNTTNLPTTQGAQSLPEIWQGLDAGMKAFRAAYPQKQILAATPAPAEGTLYFLAKNRHAQDPRAHMRMGGEQIVFDQRTGELFDRTHRTYRYPQIASFLHTMHILHVEMGLGRGGKIFLGVMCVLTIFSIISGFMIYKPFRKGKPFGLTGRHGRGFWSDMHLGFSVFAAVFALVLTLSGVFVVLNSIGGDIYRQDAARVAMQLVNHEGTPISPDVALQTIETSFPNKRIVSMRFPEKDGTPYAFFLADAGMKPTSYTRTEMAYVPSKGDLVAEFVPTPAWLSLTPLFLNLHIHNHDTLLLKIFWGILLLACAVMTITGAWLWFMRFRPAPSSANSSQGNLPSGQWHVWRLPIILGVLLLLGLILPLWGGIAEILGTLAMLLALLLFLWKFRRQA